ncbi:hypothetical protein BGZ74_000699 [Mortierella antarctica]|nr:hypothetical protein BGZ74_000699 [Mortierella antarctica]
MWVAPPGSRVRNAESAIYESVHENIESVPTASAAVSAIPVQDNDLWINDF